MKAHTHFKHTINPSGRYVLTARWRAERFYALLKQSAAAVPITGFLCTKAPMLRVPDKRSGWHRVGWAPPGVGPPRPRGSAFGCLPGGPSPLGREGGSAPPELPVVLSSHQNWEFMRETRLNKQIFWSMSLGASPTRPQAAARKILREQHGNHGAFYYPIRHPYRISYGRSRLATWIGAYLGYGAYLGEVRASYFTRSQSQAALLIVGHPSGAFTTSNVFCMS
jgi:hypothetical protein